MRHFRKAFRSLPDPRAENASHDLLEILLIALAAVLYVPGLQQVFHLSALQAQDLVFPVIASLVAVVWFECVKFGFSSLFRSG